MKKSLNKKAEMTSKMLIGLILLIISFALILILIFNFNFDDTIDRSVCHTSVILRGTITDKFDLKEAVPLKCETRKVCITSKSFGKGECEKELGDKYNTIRVSSDKEKMQSEINMFIAREMADCWEMMGAGKIQIFAREFELSKLTKKCSVCSRIAFDDTIKTKIDKVNGLETYLMNYNVPNKNISYFEFLFRTNKKISLKKDEFSTNQKAIVFVEFAKSEAILKTYGGLMAVGSGIIGGVLLGPGGAIVGFVGGYMIGSKSGAEIERYNTIGKFGEEFPKLEIGKGKLFSSTSFFIDYDESLNKLECKSFENIA